METLKLITQYEHVPENYTGIIEYPNGSIYYYVNGKCHREDGPAVIWDDGSLWYYIHGKNITKEVNNWIKENNIPDYKLWNNSHKILFKLTFV